MVKALFDTNILIDYLNGVAAAHDEISRYQDGAISIVTWMEVMVGANDVNVRQTRAFLSAFVNCPAGRGDRGNGRDDPASGTPAPTGRDHLGVCKARWPPFGDSQHA